MVIGVGDTVLYCNYAQFDVTTREILVSGNVRIYRGEKVFAGDRPAVGDEEFLPFAQGGLGQGGL